MKLMADENVEKPVVDRLRNNGHDVVFLHELTSRTDDEEGFLLS
jgi:hypothetical protein